MCKLLSIVALLLICVGAWAQDVFAGASRTVVYISAYGYGIRNTIGLRYIPAGSGSLPVSYQTDASPATADSYYCMIDGAKSGNVQFATKGNGPMDVGGYQLSGFFDAGTGPTRWYWIILVGTRYAWDPPSMTFTPIRISCDVNGLITAIYDLEGNTFPGLGGSPGGGGSPYTGRTAAEQDQADTENRNWFLSLFIPSETSKNNLIAALNRFKGDGAGSPTARTGEMVNYMASSIADEGQATKDLSDPKAAAGGYQETFPTSTSWSGWGANNAGYYHIPVNDLPTNDDLPIGAFGLSASQPFLQGTTFQAFRLVIRFLLTIGPGLWFLVAYWRLAGNLMNTYAA